MLRTLYGKKEISKSYFLFFLKHQNSPIFVIFSYELGCVVRIFSFALWVQHEQKWMLSRSAGLEKRRQLQSAGAKMS